MSWVMKFATYTLGTVLALSGAMTTAKAQEPENDPNRGVARVSLVRGDVLVQRGDSGERTAAIINAPLVTDDRVSTEPGARAEVQYDFANMLRLAENSEVRLSDVAPGRYQAQIGRGTVMLAVVRDSRAQVEVDTPSVAVRPEGRGAIRIAVFDDGHSEITVRAGRAEVYTKRGTEKLEPGQTMMVRGSPDDPEFQVVNAAQQDDFDQWNYNRDQHFTRTRSYEHVNPEINGAEDLDAYGRWVDTTDYGSVWTPTVGADWAPYRDGRWVWTDGYGWTWVDYEPWGWAPFHYGRWFYGAGIGWCWYPGPIHVRPYWSPALVAFFGVGGFHAGIGFGGGFGWVPLAPFEVCHPWWGRGVYGGYRVTNINIVNNVNISNTYRNARALNGVTVVGTNDFANGRFTHATSLRPGQLAQASLVRGQVPIAPTVASRRFTDRAIAAPVRSSAFSNNSRFFSHNPAPMANRVPFSQQQQVQSPINRGAMSSNAGVRPGPTGGAAANSPQSWRGAPTPAGRVAPQATSVSGIGSSRAPAASSSWGRFGEPAPAATRSNAAPQYGNRGWATAGDRPATATPRGQSYQGTPSDGWRRFQPGSASSGYSSRPQSVQIAPPIVRERSFGNSGYGSARPAAPRPSAAPSSSGRGGSYSAPSHAASAPSGGGGGGHHH